MDNNSNQKVLDEILKKMESLDFRENKNSWLKFYGYLKKIEREELFNYGYPNKSRNNGNFRYTTDSFNDWIKAYCKDKDHSMRPRRMREIIKAGDILTSYRDKRNIDLESLTIPPPETLVNVKKIALESKGSIDDLIEKAMSGEISRDGSRKLLKQVRDCQSMTDSMLQLEMAKLITENGSWLGEDGIYKGFSDFPLVSDKTGTVIFSDRSSREISCHRVFYVLEENDLVKVLKEVENDNLNKSFDYIWIFQKDNLTLENSEVPNGIGIIECSPVLKIVRQAEKQEEADTLYLFQNYVKKIH